MKKKTAAWIALVLGTVLLGGQVMPAQACKDGQGHTKPPAPTTPAPEPTQP